MQELFRQIHENPSAVLQQADGPWVHIVMFSAMAGSDPFAAKEVFKHITPVTANGVLRKERWWLCLKLAKGYQKDAGIPLKMIDRRDSLAGEPAGKHPVRKNIELRRPIPNDKEQCRKECGECGKLVVRTRQYATPCATPVMSLGRTRKYRRSPKTPS